MAIVTVGIDPAKNVFAVHGVDKAGKAVLVRSEVPRAKLVELIVNVPPCEAFLRQLDRIRRDFPLRSNGVKCQDWVVHSI